MKASILQEDQKQNHEESNIELSVSHTVEQQKEERERKRVSRKIIVTTCDS